MGKSLEKRLLVLNKYGKKFGKKSAPYHVETKVTGACK